MEKPKPKQETLEKAAERMVREHKFNAIIEGIEFQQEKYDLLLIELNHTKTLLANCEKALEDSFKKQERMYSVEEVLEHLNLLYSMKNSMVDTFTNDDDYITMKWFEQFKKK